MAFPVDVRGLYSAGKRLTQERDKEVRIAVLVEIDAPDELVEAARAALHPRTAKGLIDVSVVEPGTVARVDAKADAAIVLAGSGTHVRETLAGLHRSAIPTAVVALRGEKAEVARSLDHPDDDTVVGSDPEAVISGPLADWMVARLDKLRTALAHNFEFVRRAVAKESVKATAWQNAAIGVAVFIPGADMPLMTMNEAKMLLQIAAAYGQPIDAQRVKELTAVVGGGFLLREFAREALDFVPVLGWAVKGGIAYAGTLAMGMAAIGYFEEGTDVSGVVRSLGERAGELSARADAARRRALEHRGRAHGAGEGYTAPVPLRGTPSGPSNDDELLVDMGPGDLPDPGPRPGRRPAPGACAPSAAGAQPTLLDVPFAAPTLTVEDGGTGGAGTRLP